MVGTGHRPGLIHPLSLEIALVLFGGSRRTDPGISGRILFASALLFHPKALERMSCIVRSIRQRQK
jgi:hypothetical protein